MILENPVSRHRVDTSGAFSFPALILGPLWFFVKGMILPGVLAVIGVTITLGFGWLALPFIFNSVYRRHLLARGYEPLRVAPADSAEVRSAKADPVAQAEAVRAMAADAAKLPVDVTACMECGSHDKVEAREFGFARILDVRKDYGEAGAAAGASVISALLGGPVMLKGAKTTTTANIIRSQLVFCHVCLDRRKNFVGLPKITDRDYALHPWWGAAQQHGFTTHLDSYDLMKYKSQA